MTDLDKLIAAVEAGGESIGAIARLTLYEHWPEAQKAHLGDLNAAHALHKAVLPDTRARIDIGKRFRAWIVFPDNSKLDAYAATPARAWLLSILRAMKERGDG